MSEHDGGRAHPPASVQELLDLLGLGGKSSASGSTTVPSSATRHARHAGEPASSRPIGSPPSTEVLRCDDGVRRLHIYGCGKQPIKLSKSRCRVFVHSWGALATFSMKGGRPGTRLTDQVAVREVNEVIVVEIGGEPGRPMRFTPEKLRKLLGAQDAIRAFAG